ncbi:hypothetical protein PN836_009665 [Ningiella sp. W23]|uniref:hypothetical protein n=1 Tax=Ningiella sp. W23 TaxID=3023715 RepID=UPI003756E68D
MSGSPLVKSPRPVFVDFLLACFTLSLYLAVWLYQSVRDLKRVNQKDLTPWMWLFVPIFFIPLFFALPVFLRSIRECEEKLEIISWSKARERCWLFSVLALSVATIAVEYLGASSLQQLSLIAVWIAGFFSIGPRINQIRATSELGKTKLYGALSIFEWIVSIIMAPFLAFVLWYSGLNAIISSVQEFEPGQVYSNNEHNFSLRFDNDQWHQVRIGTYSNGEALMEFSGHNSDAYIVIFVQDERSDIGDLTQWRIDESFESLTNASCKESRSFLTNSFRLRVVVICEGAIVGDPAIERYELIQIDDEKYIEAYAYFNPTQTNFARNRDSFNATVSSLMPLSESN